MDKGQNAFRSFLSFSQFVSKNSNQYQIAVSDLETCLGGR
jgi:hypothetical protein